MRASASFAPFSLLLALTIGAAPACADETLHYRWRLDGFLGSIASVFVPSGGEGVLTVAQQPGGIVRSELLVTSTQSKTGDYFRYGAEWQSSTGQTLRAWSDQVWRGEKKEKRSEVEQPKVIDVVSGIQALRLAPPTVPQRLEIWSDGHLYPVLVLPRGLEKRKLGERDTMTTHLEIRGLKVADRKLWKGELDLWIADDPASTPVEIQVTKKGVRVRLIFLEREEGAIALSPVPTPGGG